LIYFGIVAWNEKSDGYLIACLWIIIAMLSHFKELKRLCESIQRG
jgi:hypothetical protein